MEVAKTYMFRATMVAIGSMVGAFVMMFVTNLIIAQQREAIPVVQMQVSDLAAPPPLTQDTPPPQVQVAPAAAPPAAAIPVPVPDAEAPEEQTIMSQEEIMTSTPGMAETGEGQQIVVAPAEDELPKFGDYVYVEELPEAITRVPPQYPDLAREAGVDGTVMVQALVGKDGKVKDVRVVKSIPMLDENAKAAVRQWVFKPALSNNKPVAVWVGVPVKFSLH
jgi:protein TonB